MGLLTAELFPTRFLLFVSSVGTVYTHHSPQWKQDNLPVPVPSPCEPIKQASYQPVLNSPAESWPQDHLVLSRKTQVSSAAPLPRHQGLYYQQLVCQGLNPKPSETLMLIIHAFHIVFIANHAPLHGLSEGGKLWLSLLTGLCCAVVGCHLDSTADASRAREPPKPCFAQPPSTCHGLF